MLQFTPTRFYKSELRTRILNFAIMFFLAFVLCLLRLWLYVFFNFIICFLYFIRLSTIVFIVKMLGRDCGT